MNALVVDLEKPFASSTPTSASWPNMVERFFRDLSENRIKRDK